MKNTATAVLLVLLIIIPMYGQNVEPRYVVQAHDDAACELTSRHIDTLVQKAKETNDRIFIVSRLGKSEKNQILLKARLVEPLSILVSVKSVPANKVVGTMGYAVSNTQGGTEFYLGSELFLVSYAKTGKGVCFQ